MLLWLKAFHLIAMVAWFAGLFYMFRLFVNRVDCSGGAAGDAASNDAVGAVLDGMAERLERIIMTPAMIATLLGGLAMLIANPGYLLLTWIQLKLVLVAGLVAYHFYTTRVRRRFATGDLYLTSRQCRLRNEIPTLFLVSIILLAVLRPTLG